MATQPYSAGASPYLGAVQGFMKGYDWGSDIIDKRRTRATEDMAADKAASQERKRSELAKLIATGVTAIPGAEPAKQNAQFAGQAPVEAIPTPASPATISNATGFGIPNAAPGATAPAAPAAPTIAEAPDDPEITQMEAKLEQDTGRNVFTRADKDRYRKAVLAKTAELGDPDAVIKAEKYLDDMDRRGFNQNASKAAIAAEMGDTQAAISGLKKMWGYVNDGRSPSIQALPGGKYMLMPMSEESGPDGQNKPAGQPMILDAASIGKLKMMSDDVAEYTKFAQGVEKDAKASGLAERKFTADEENRTAVGIRADRTATIQEQQINPDKGTIAYEYKKAQIASLKAKSKLAADKQKSGKSSAASAEMQRFTSNIRISVGSDIDILTSIADNATGEEDIKAATDKLNEYLANIDDLIGFTNTIAKSTDDLDASKAKQDAQKLIKLKARLPGFEWAIDNGEILYMDSTGKIEKLKDLVM